MKTAPKIKPQERTDGSIIKLIQFIIRNGNVSNNKNIVRLIELFTAVVVNVTETGRHVCHQKNDIHDMGDSIYPDKKLTNGKYSSEGAAREWSTVSIVVVFDLT